MLIYYLIILGCLYALSDRNGFMVDRYSKIIMNSNSVEEEVEEVEIDLTEEDVEIDLTEELEEVDLTEEEYDEEDYMDDDWRGVLNK